MGSKYTLIVRNAQNSDAVSNDSVPDMGPAKSNLEKLVRHTIKAVKRKVFSIVNIRKVS